MEAVEFVLEHETEFQRGHYGDWNFVRTEHDPTDRGGATRYGLDARTHGDVENLTKDQAIAIYYSEYWVPSHAMELPLGVGEAIFDIKVNGGKGILWLQEALNHIGIPCSADGIFGPATKAAAQKAGLDALKALCNRREQYYRAIVDAHPSQAKFLQGWINRSADLEKFAMSVQGSETVA
jgi:lysozyme family protein